MIVTFRLCFLLMVALALVMPGANLRAQPAAYVEAVTVRKHKVEDQQIGGVRPQGGNATRHVAGHIDAVAGRAEVVAHHRGEPRVVVDHQQPLHLANLLHAMESRGRRIEYREAEGVAGSGVSGAAAGEVS